MDGYGGPPERPRPIVVIRVGPDEGIGHESVATFDNLAALPRSVLTTRLGQLGLGGRRQICDALDALVNC